MDSDKSEYLLPSRIKRTRTWRMMSLRSSFPRSTRGWRIGTQWRSRFCWNGKAQLSRDQEQASSRQRKMISQALASDGEEEHRQSTTFNGSASSCARCIPLRFEHSGGWYDGGVVSWTRERKRGEVGGEGRAVRMTLLPLLCSPRGKELCKRFCRRFRGDVSAGEDTPKGAVWRRQVRSDSPRRGTNAQCKRD